jgi:DNA-binding transcriptional ArsR family regulator
METTLRYRAEAGAVDDVEKATRIADILKAVAHPLRLRIVAVLCKREMQVNALAARLGAPQASSRSSCGSCACIGWPRPCARTGM